MIPAYNNVKWLGETLQSVLNQDLGLESMQIEVVDDGSPSDEIRETVRTVGRGRVSYFRQTSNVGAISNFNTCLQRSLGHLIHILHADDLVIPGFYKKIYDLAEQMPQLSFFCARARIFRNSKKITLKSPTLDWLNKNHFDAAPLYYLNIVRTPCVVIRRDFYERFGGFDLQLQHSADWEMWIRAVHFGGGAFLNEPLALYRSSQVNDTARLQLSAENLRSWIKISDKLERNYPDFSSRKFFRCLFLFGFLQVFFLWTYGKWRAGIKTICFLRDEVWTCVLKKGKNESPE